MTVKVFAPAKVNLTLHVTGQRDDGYHLIDSLVAFGPIGDHLTIDDAGVSSLTVEGPEAAGVPADMDNLVMQVAAIMAPGRGLAMSLHKNLPVASGIGGGSADAAAALRALVGAGDLADLSRDIHRKIESVCALGADIRMCQTPRPQRVRGIGADCRAAEFPSLPALLVNPGIAVSTRDVFAALANNTNPPMDENLPDFGAIPDFVQWLENQRNDLTEPACRICPEIRDVLGTLSGLHGCMLARMSGSGATCFAIFSTLEMAQSAGRRLRNDHPEWWIADGLLGDWAAKSAPGFS